MSKRVCDVAPSPSWKTASLTYELVDRQGAQSEVNGELFCQLLGTQGDLNSLETQPGMPMARNKSSLKLSLLLLPILRLGKLKKQVGKTELPSHGSFC